MDRFTQTQGFGLDLRFDAPEVPGAWEERAGAGDVVAVTQTDPGELDAAWSGAAEPGWEATIDGVRFAVERGASGDHRFVRGGRTLAHLDPAASTLRFAIADEEATDDWRCLLDSALFSVALIRGREALHAGAVALGSRAVAVAAGSGGGKSSLLTALLAAGAELLSDDVTVLETGKAVLAHPGPPLMTVPNAIEHSPGRPIADLGEESWRAIEVASAPARLGAIVLLDRSAAEGVRLEPVERPLAPLLSAPLRFPRTAGRERSRFELAARVAESVRVLHLHAGPEVPPAALAAALGRLDFDIERRPD